MSGLFPPPLGLAGLLNSVLESRVTHVRLSPYYNALASPGFEHIVALHGPNWTMTREQVVAAIDRGQRFYTDQDTSPRAYLEVMPPVTLLGARYVRTRPDCTRANNLLSLPRF